MIVYVVLENTKEDEKAVVWGEKMRDERWEMRDIRRSLSPSEERSMKVGKEAKEALRTPGL